MARIRPLKYEKADSPLASNWTARSPRRARHERPSPADSFPTLSPPCRRKEAGHGCGQKKQS
jgi:hypothetical protein